MSNIYIMNELNLNLLLDREEEEKKFIEMLANFEENKKLLQTRRGMYVYGSPGCGKTLFVKNLLKKLNYDVICFDAGDVRNKCVIETITKHNITENSIISLFGKKKKKIAIIMDEIDGMNSGDKGGINALTKLIRPKKTIKQKKEAISMNPIICIGNYHLDKKIQEIRKVCLTIELKTPTDKQIKSIISKLMPKLDTELLNNMTEFIQGDLRKLQSTIDIYNNQQTILKNKIIQNMFQTKIYNEDVKDIVKKLIRNKYKIEEHFYIMNETDRTSVGLLFHENIIESFGKSKWSDKVNFYLKVLNNICFSDYIDRITFQKQIWIFNEMSSLIKTVYNNNLYHDSKIDKTVPNTIRFTKVLTKYSTEYNNMLFLNDLCEKLQMDRKDLLGYFEYLRCNNTIEEIYTFFDNNQIELNKLDINRIYRFIDKLKGISK